MKICYIGDGESVHNHFMVEWFVKRGHEVLFLTDTPESFPFPHLQQQVAPRHGGGPFRHLYAAYNARRWIREWKPDVVHAHNVTGYGYWGALSGFSPLVVTAWGSDLNVYAAKNALLKHILSFCLKKADLITGDAEDLCQTARTLSGGSVETRLLQWGVDFSPFDREPDADHRDWIRGGKEVVFLSTRRLRPIYNIGAIIKAFAQARPNLPPSRLVVVGDDVLKNDLENLAKELHLGDGVLFTGWLPTDKLHQTITSCDAFVSTPSSDSTALSLLEAFAARLPVIAADLPANREWIDSGKNGLLVPAGDVEKLKDAMIDIGSDPNRRIEWGQINRRLAKERGDRNKEMLKLERWYEKLAQRKKNAGCSS